MLVFKESVNIKNCESNIPGVRIDMLDTEGESMKGVMFRAESDAIINGITKLVKSIFEDGSGIYYETLEDTLDSDSAVQNVFDESVKKASESYKERKLISKLPVNKMMFYSLINRDSETAPLWIKLADKLCSTPYSEEWSIQPKEFASSVFELYASLDGDHRQRYLVKDINRLYSGDLSVFGDTLIKHVDILVHFTYDARYGLCYIDSRLEDNLEDRLLTSKQRKWLYSSEPFILGKNLAFGPASYHMMPNIGDGVTPDEVSQHMRDISLNLSEQTLKVRLNFKINRHGGEDIWGLFFKTSSESDRLFIGCWGTWMQRAGRIYFIPDADSFIVK